MPKTIVEKLNQDGYCYLQMLQCGFGDVNHDGKIRSQGNLKCTARQFGIRDPLNLPLEEIHTQLQVCKEQCEYFRQHGHRYRQKHLQKWLQHAWETYDETVEKATLVIINCECDRVQWKTLNVAMKRRRGRSVCVCVCVCVFPASGYDWVTVSA